MGWRTAVGKPTYGAFHTYKPIVAVGAEHALEEAELVADYFRRVIPRPLLGRETDMLRWI